MVYKLFIDLVHLSYTQVYEHYTSYFELQSCQGYVITILGSGPLMVISNVPEGWMAL